MKSSDWWNSTVSPVHICYKVVGIKQMVMAFRQLDEIYTTEMKDSHDNANQIRNALKKRLVCGAIILRANALLENNDKRFIKV